MWWLVCTRILLTKKWMMIQISVKYLSLQWFNYRGFDFCFRTSIKSRQSDCSAYCSCSETGRELIQLMIRSINQSVPDKRRKKRSGAFVRCTEAFIYKVLLHIQYIYIYSIHLYPSWVSSNIAPSSWTCWMVFGPIFGDVSGGHSSQRIVMHKLLSYVLVDFPGKHQRNPKSKR